MRREERNGSSRGETLPSQCVQRCAASRSASGLPMPHFARRSCRQRIVGRVLNPPAALPIL